MSTVLDPPASRTSPAERLRTTMAAVRVTVRWLGVRKTLTPEQKARAADPFGAEGDFLSAGKKLLDTNHPAFKRVRGVKHKAVGYWKGITLPYPEPGIRLIRQDDLDMFDVQMRCCVEELNDAVAELDRHYGQLKRAAAQRLGSLYNPADYPEQLTGLFGLEWEFPSVEPPEYLRDLNPGLYEQEAARATARFDEAVQLAEQAFAEELEKLIAHLAERLSGSTDGRPKIFRDSAVENLGEFFQRFRRLNVRSSEQLDELVEQARRLVDGVEPQQLRDNGGLRERVAAGLTQVHGLLDDLLVDRPRRNLLRRAR